MGGAVGGEGVLNVWGGGGERMGWVQKLSEMLERYFNFYIPLIQPQTHTHTYTYVTHTHRHNDIQAQQTLKGTFTTYQK